MHSSVFIKKIRDAIASGDIDEIQENIYRARNSKSLRVFLRSILQSTESPIVRNAVAIKLADLRDEDAIDIIISLLSSPMCDGNQGSLLYAIKLYNYDCSHIITMLVDLVISGNYETREMALELICSIDSDIDDDLFLESRKKISKPISASSDEDNFELEKLRHIFSL